TFLRSVGAPKIGVINVKTTFLRPVLDVDATGAKIKSLMKQRGITPRQLQVILNFPYVQTVYNWFAGKNMPTIDNLIVLAQVLGVTVDEIIVTKMVDIEIEDMQGVEALIA
ncbi:MAG: helix-turn-helix transcriptional regulator, partial [Treponema sp.]|nr:helix-turn-helix transcriptional regulator [Treponema sp.]